MRIYARMILSGVCLLLTMWAQGQTAASTALAATDSERANVQEGYGQRQALGFRTNRDRPGTADVHGARAEDQTPIQIGDVFAGECDSYTMDTEFGETDAFSPAGVGAASWYIDNGQNLCTTSITVAVSGNTFIDTDQSGTYEFDPWGNLIGCLGCDRPIRQKARNRARPNYIDFEAFFHDQAGNFYFAYGGPVLELSPDGKTETEYQVAGGASWAAIASDQHTLIYVSAADGTVKSFDMTTLEQGPDLITAISARMVAVLPDNSLLVTIGSRAGSTVSHWAAPCQSCTPYQQVMTYKSLPATATDLALDPDGVSFWTVHPWCCDEYGDGNADLYRTVVKSGAKLMTFSAGLLEYGRTYSGSVAVYGFGMNSTASSTPALTFKSQLIGTASAPKPISIKNTGQVEMTVSNVAVTGDFAIGKNLCSSGIRPGTHCNLYVQFEPTQLGARTGTVSVYDNAANSPQTTNLSGTAVTTSSTSLASAPNPSVQGQAVTFTAEVTSGAPNPPTGTVIFKNGTHTIGKATLSAGVAVMTTSKLPVGSLSITAAYSGDTVNVKSTSAVLTQVVNPR